MTKKIGTVAVRFDYGEAYQVFPTRATDEYGLIRNVPKRAWDRYERQNKQLEVAKIALFRAAGLDDKGDPFADVNALSQRVVEKTKKAHSAEEWDRSLTESDITNIQRARFSLPCHYDEKRYAGVLKEIKAALRKRKKNA